MNIRYPKPLFAMTKFQKTIHLQIQTSIQTPLLGSAPQTPQSPKTHPTLGARFILQMSARELKRRRNPIKQRSYFLQKTRAATSKKHIIASLTSPSLSHRKCLRWTMRRMRSNVDHIPASQQHPFGMDGIPPIPNHYSSFS